MTKVVPDVVTLKDFDDMVLENVWEEAFMLADDMIPVLLEASKKRGYETRGPFNDAMKMTIRRTLSLMLVCCFMNKSDLDTNSLDDALKASRTVAKKFLAGQGAFDK